MENDQTTEMDLEYQAPDFEDLAKHYSEGATEGQSKTPPPGLYSLRLPASIGETNFKVFPAKNGKAPWLQFTMDNGLRGEEAEGLAIVDGPYAGNQVRFARASTILQDVSRWDNNERKFVPVLTNEGVVRQYSDAMDILRNFGTPFAEMPTSFDEWKAALSALAGKTFPSKVKLMWKTTTKGQKNNGYDKTIYFKKEGGKNGKWVPYQDLVADFQFDQKTRDGIKVIQPGETYRVWANLSVDRQGFAPKS
jgi:hypothetical protein